VVTARMDGLVSSNFRYCFITSKRKKEVIQYGQHNNTMHLAVWRAKPLKRLS
jgi:hypothetical protein